MSRLKIILTLLILLSSLVVTSQTFVLNGATYIGMTIKEINKISEANNSKLFEENRRDGRITQIVYMDSLNGLTNHFEFARRGPFGIGTLKCFAYLVNVGDKQQYENIKADIQAKCDEKISDRSFVKVSGSKKYDWFFLGSDKSKLYTVVIQKHHRHHHVHF